MVKDENGNTFPSPEGAFEQLMDTVEVPNDFSWYSFRPVEGNPGLVHAISYDEAGEPDKVYQFRIVFVKQVM